MLVACCLLSVFHHLRHAAATFLLAQGFTLQAVKNLLGHSSITLTSNTYGHVLEQRQQEVAAGTDAVRRLLRGGERLGGRRGRHACPPTRPGETRRRLGRRAVGEWDERWIQPVIPVAVDLVSLTGATSTRATAAATLRPYRLPSVHRLPRRPPSAFDVAVNVAVKRPDAGRSEARRGRF